LTPKYQAYGYDMLAIPQAELAAVLINSGLSNHPSQIFYHFGWSLQCLHPDEATTEFSHLCEDGDGGGSSSVEKMSVTADLVVGADGLHSKTREELEWKTPSFSSSLQQIPAGRHLRLRVPMDVVGTQIDEAGRVHGPSMLVVVRSSRLLWGLPNCDGTMALTLQGIKGSTTSDVSKEMSESFPELAEIFSVDAEATRQLAGAKERTQGTVVATTFNYKQTVKLQNILGILFLI
jgi:2-polyprenyl-6-methoxyphenol hydroxylase-like FAD-dependent oxidoreductase